MSEQTLLILNSLPPSPFEAALLPWEDGDAFCQLREEYFVAYPPRGPAERHILEQLVWCDWRRRRLVLGERALHIAQIDRRTNSKRKDDLTQRALLSHGDEVLIGFSSQEALASNASDDEDLAADTADDLEKTNAALAMLETGRPDAYEQALAALRDDSREYWGNHGPGDEPETYPPNAHGLSRFIACELMPLLRRNEAEARLRPEVRLQAWGESLDPDRMDRLMQLDERLTRQYEKLLGMLERVRRLSARMTS